MQLSGKAPSARGAGQPLYGKSRALVIGIDRYTAGWPRLGKAVSDARIVQSALKDHGFDVRFLKDPDAARLESELKRFYVVDGADPDTRLFLWFAGHGHTEDGLGFLVPADAPKPGGPEFRLKALSMERFGELVRLAKAKHAYAAFDSCFSGTIFSSQRAMPSAAITRATTLPVRQFISAGDADQTVSDDGRFRKLFVRAITEGGAADANRDGFVTGSEIGLYLSDSVTNATRGVQTPRYGKLRHEDYNRGDFVFRLGGGAITSGAFQPPAAARPAPAPVMAQGAPRDAFSRLLSRLRTTRDPDTKLRLLRDTHLRFDAQQVRTLLDEVRREAKRLQALELLAPRMTQRRPAPVLLQAFRFRKNKDKATQLLTP